MKKTISWVDNNFEPILITILFYLMMGLVTLQVILRFVFNTGIAGAEEISRFIFIWLMYFSFSYTTRRQSHIKITFLLDRLKTKTRKIVMIFVDILFLLFSGIIFWSAWKICQSVILFKDKAVTIDISMNIVYGAGLIGFALMFIRLIQGLVWKFKHFNSSIDIFENIGGIHSENNNILTNAMTEKLEEKI
ncbi:TRAP transporter small permease [Sporosarcina ureae]|uniref:TRAP transporter small permease n=1 Tax=Sporosarcina ureae TaxID=1571 RepID=UPI0026E99B6A|nr:TRAP transporter small permease [Sporosarcina ureae]